MAKDIKQLKKIITRLGFDLSNGKWGIKVYMHAIITCFLIINSSLFVVNKWEDVGKRLDGAKGLVLQIMCLIAFIALTCQWNNSILLINIMEDGLSKGMSQPSTNESKLRIHIETGITQLNTIWYYGIICYTVMMLVTPVSVFVVRLVQYDINDITTEMLYTSLPFYFPKSYENITVYILAYIMQSVFLNYGTLTSYVAIVSAFNSMQLIEGEIKLLRLSLQEFDAININNNCLTRDESKMYLRNYSHAKSKLLLDSNSKNFLKYFVRHHYSICRKVNDVTKGIQLVAFSINSGMSILLCTAIYSIAKRKEILVVTQEAIFGSFITFCLYCYNLMGEKISTQDEHFRKALYESAWVDKQQWFKKSFQIMMSRTSRPIEIKSAGFFVFNLRNFILTVRAAYSYYNVLSNL